MDLSPKIIETGLVAFTTFFAVIGPIDVAAVYAGLTAGMPPRQRRRTAIKGVLVVHSETATGMTNPVAAYRKAMDAAKHPALLLADTISSLASIDFRMDEWGVDVAVGGAVGVGDGRNDGAGDGGAVGTDDGTGEGTPVGYQV